MPMPTPCRTRGPAAPARLALPLAAVLLLLPLAGCRGGMRSFSAPKWPSLGDAKSKTVDAPALAAAPSTSGPIQKPSAAATPYPTSSTPAGYVVNDPASASGVSPSVIQTAATDPQAVTYGETPPLPPPEASVPPNIAATAAPAEAPAINPQVGPYATLPAPPPASESPITPGLPGAVAANPPAVAPIASPADPAGGAFAPAAAAAPAAAGTFPATAGYEPSARMAVAPPAAEQTPPMIPVAPAEPGGGVQARYASQGSRFGGPSADPAVLAPAAMAPIATAPYADAPAPVAVAPAAPVAAPLPGLEPAAGTPPPAPIAPATLPPGTPDGLTSPPVRRPDPVFRPGGTSSYRPAEQIFADDAPVAPSNVRTASFESIESIDPPPSSDAAILR